MVARIGLVLSVVAWVVSQWVRLDIFVAQTSFISTPVGWLLVNHYHWPVARESSIGILSDMNNNTKMIQFVEDSGTSCFGFGYLAQSAVYLSFRHWLVVTFFALFYGVLKWVYRKRGKAVVDV